MGQALKLYGSVKVVPPRVHLIDSNAVAFGDMFLSCHGTSRLWYECSYSITITNFLESYKFDIHYVERTLFAKAATAHARIRAVLRKLRVTGVGGITTYEICGGQATGMVSEPTGMYGCPCLA